MKTLPIAYKTITVAGLLALGSAGTVRADNVMPSYDANPEIYKVIAENEEMRVILATWPAGTKDKIHSHPKSHASYSLSDCHRKLVKPDGTVDERKAKAGVARIAPPIKAHYFENVGSTTCQTLLVELK